MSELSLSSLSAAIFCCCLSFFFFFFSLPVLGFAPAPSPSPSPTIESLTVALHAAVNAAIKEDALALRGIRHLLRKPISSSERAAMSDCSEFYDNSILYLKRTFEPDATSVDVQIWLSAVATCFDNCDTSISEMKMTRPAFLNRSKAPELTNECLAINHEIMKMEGIQD